MTGQTYILGIFVQLDSFSKNHQANPNDQSSYKVFFFAFCCQRHTLSSSGDCMFSYLDATTIKFWERTYEAERMQPILSWSIYTYNLIEGVEDSIYFRKQQVAIEVFSISEQ